MSRPISLVARLTGTAGIVAFAVLGVRTALDVAGREHVLEFQAGPPSGLGERALGWAQQSGLEGVGFLAVTFALSVVAVAVGAARRRAGGSLLGASLAQESVAAFALASAAFAAWVGFGTWLGGEILPFLPKAGLAALSAAGFAAIFLGLWVGDAIAARLPFAPRSEPAARSLGLAAAFGVAMVLAVGLLKGGGGWRSPRALLPAAALLAGSIPVGAFVGKVLEGAVAAAGRRLAAGGLLPRPVAAGLSLVLLACAGIGAATFSFSAVPDRAEYRTIAAPGNPAGPNVVFITIDTLRADRLGCYGYGRPTSPFLDGLAKEGALFLDAVAPASWTKPSTGTLLTGLYPSRHGALYHGSELHTPPGAKTLAEAFRDAGYVTAGFVSNPNIKRIFKFDRGFAEYFDSPVEDTCTQAAFRNSVFGQVLTELTRYQFNWKNANDVRTINHHAFAWLERNRAAKFFLYLHYIDPHEPYDPPEPYRSQFAQDHGFVVHNERKRKFASDLYDGEIRYTDDHLAKLADELRRHGLWENTVVIVTSDHGEEFFEHGVLGHGFSLYQEVVHVPLLARGPGIAKGAVVRKPVAIVDLAATVLELSGVQKGTFNDGTSFAPALADPAWSRAGDFYMESEFGQDEHDIRSFVFSGLREGDFKLVVNEQNIYRPPDDPKYGRLELYDLAGDPSERRNLLHDAERKNDLDPRIEAWLERLKQHALYLEAPGFRKIKPTALDEKTLKELRNIGYMGGGR